MKNKTQINLVTEREANCVEGKKHSIRLRHYQTKEDNC